MKKGATSACLSLFLVKPPSAERAAPHLRALQATWGQLEQEGPALAGPRTALRRAARPGRSGRLPPLKARLLWRVFPGWGLSPG